MMVEFCRRKRDPEVHRAWGRERLFWEVRRPEEMAGCWKWALGGGGGVGVSPAGDVRGLGCSST